MTMPPASDDPEASRPYFRRLRELAQEHGLRELSMGTSQDYRVAAEEGATYVRVGSVLYGHAEGQSLGHGRCTSVRGTVPRTRPAREVGFAPDMALGDLWNRTLVYFGIAEEDEWDDDYAATEELERSYEERRANVRRLSPRKRDRDPDDWTEPAQQAEPRPARLRRVDSSRAAPAPRRRACTSSSRGASTTPSRSRTSTRSRSR